jgi:hypothetical protein
MSDKHMLTTIDNPFDPFTEYEEWEAYDEDAGYYTPAYLARVAITSDELSEADQDLSLEDAILEIIDNDPLGIYIRVTENMIRNPGNS